MNTPNPLVPHGSLQSRGKSTVRTAFFTIAAIHVVFIGGLLIQGGCKKSDDKEVVTTETAPPELPPMDVADSAFSTNYEAPVVTNQGIEPPIFSNDVPATTAAPSQTYTSAPPPTYQTAPPAYEVPPPAATGTREYTVVRGDSFSSIASKMGTTVRAIEQANPGVNPLRLQIGQKLQIPAASSPSATSTATPSTNGDTIIYTVKAGDVLERIASKNGTTIKEIMRLNNLKTTMIRVGQKLQLPARGTSNSNTSNGFGAPLPQ